MVCLACIIIHEQKDEALDGSYDSGIALVPAGWVVTLALLALMSELVMLLLHFLNPSCFNNYYVAFGGIVSNLYNMVYDFVSICLQHRTLPKVLWLVLECSSDLFL